MSSVSGSLMGGAPASPALGLVLALSLMLGLPAEAHGPFASRLERATRAIAEDPESPQPLFFRADLYREHGDFDAARADLDRAAELAPQQPEVDYYRGVLFLDAADPDRALAALSRFHSAEPRHAAGHAESARALVALGRPVEAATAYSRAITYDPLPTPDYFLERARALAEAGPAYLAAAIAGLEEGIAALGPIPSLTRTTVSFEMRAGRHEAALTRIEREIAVSRQPIWWLALKAELLENAGQRAQSREAYARALQILEAKPAQRRRSSAWRELEDRLQSAVTRLDRGPARPGAPGK